MTQKTQLEKDIQALEAKLNEMKATVEAMPSEAPARWVPKDDQENYWAYMPEHYAVQCVTRYFIEDDRFARDLKVGNVHRTKEDAENYRLRLESFVPALGPETPSLEVLNSGFCHPPSGIDITKAKGWSPEFVIRRYQDGSWQPTREAAEEWLAKYGKARGYTQ